MSEQLTGFAKIKWEVGQIQFNYLGMNKERTAIEANPSTHRIAQYIEQNYVPKIPSPVSGSLEDSKRCEHELTVAKYFGLPESVQESDKIQTDYGQLVNLVAMAREGYPKGASHSFNKESFLKALRDGNPYAARDDYWKKAYLVCCNKAAELLNQKDGINE